MQPIKQLLPIGSVVLLKGADKPLMVCGVRQSLQNTREEFDYISVPWPEGYIGPQKQYLFNHEKVENIMFSGFNNEVREKFIDKLEKIYK